MTRSHIPCTGLLAVGALLLLGGCGGGSGHSTPTPPAASATRTPARTPTQPPTGVPTATPTLPSPANGLFGLVVVGNDVAPNSSELGMPPEGWGRPADQSSFDRSLAHAEYTVAGTAIWGATTADGSFVIPDLPPGRYTIELTKTVDGNLIPVTVPIVIGDGNDSQVIVEIGRGLARTTSSYSAGGSHYVETMGPYGTRVVVRDGQTITELGDPTRTLHDADGDGRFDPEGCTETPSLCDFDSRDCPDGSYCLCVASCPFCEDCGEKGVCAGRANRYVYRCSDDASCTFPNDRCVTLCPECPGGPLHVCIPDCQPVEIQSILINGPAQVGIGRAAQLYATAQLSDGSVVDVTYLATWQTSDSSVATIDSWGRLSANSPGSVSVTATLGAIVSQAWKTEIVERPALRSIAVQNTACFCAPILLDQTTSDALWAPCYFYGSGVPDFLAIPACKQVLLVGRDLQFQAIGEYADDSREDITASVTWSVEPAGRGSITAGRFTATAPGEATIRASAGDVSSEPTTVRVVSEASVESLSIYPVNYAYDAMAGAVTPRPDPTGGMPCPDCGYSLAILTGDTLPFQATARYDTGEWRDVTNEVTWSSSDSATGTIAKDGILTALAAGSTDVEATLGEIRSNPVTVRVVDEAVLDSISIYQEGTDRVVARADQRFFHAIGIYDIGITRDLTASVTWRSSNDAVGSFDGTGVFTARAAGIIQVWAETEGQRSNTLDLEVYETSELSYCDPNDINRAVWWDDFNRVVLESDCRDYRSPGLVTLRYTVTETQPHGGIFDPCLDLYVYEGERRIRTIREEGCGEPFLPGPPLSQDAAALKYQLRAYWDLKDDAGRSVPPGNYTIYGRFYLYYDPVIAIPVNVLDPSGTPRPTRPPILPTPQPTALPERAVELSIGSASGPPGAQVSFDVTLRTLGIGVAGIQNDIVLAGLSLSDERSGQPRCTLDPAIDKPASTFALLPRGCTGGNCETLRALIAASGNLDPLPDGAVLYRCTTTLPAPGVQSILSLGCENAVASDVRGHAIPVRCTPGSIRIVAKDPPPPPPASDIEGSCVIGSASCMAGSSIPTSRRNCCEMALRSALAVTFSWCPAGRTDAAGRCLGCELPCNAEIFP